MNKSDRIVRSERARSRRRTLKSIKIDLFERYCENMRSLRKKYQKIKARHLTGNL